MTFICMAEKRTWLADGLRDGFRRRDENIIQEPLPERWVDLIQYLNAQEREQTEAKHRKRLPDVPH
jgi:hypothetical protein